MFSSSVIYVVSMRPLNLSSSHFKSMSSVAIHTFHTIDELAVAYQPTVPGVVVVDFVEQNEIEALAALKSRGITNPVIFISSQVTAATAIESMKQGVLEFLIHPFNHRTLIESIELGLAMNAEKLEKQEEAIVTQERLAKLTKREREILTMVIAAKSSRVIATELGISHKTVELHRARIIDKMEVKSAMELARVMNQLRIYALQYPEEKLQIDSI